MQLIRGDVHDPGAAMLGGISGHAGLFSNAQEIAVIFQMLLQNGTYGEKRYLSEKTVSTFTARYNPGSGNRRGLGFDKPPAIWSADGPVCNGATAKSYGHSGFTGTYVWADPSNNLLYVFLSNRIHPDAGNQKLSQMNIRTDIHQTMYEILKKYQVK
jgi:CubicO group peptidase (beta-lactamase class C family)